MPTEKDMKTPEELWEHFEAYKKETQGKHRIVYEFHGKNGTERKRKLRVPLTIEGFKNYGYKIGLTFHNYFTNPDERYKEYNTICRMIKSFIRQDQIEGGMVGQYNPSITQRLNGLTDKKEIKHKGTNIPNLPDIGNRKK